jgi:predicted GNAT family N-acyltransferase
MTTDPITVRQIAVGSAEYDASVHLRHAVLRAPLGLAWAHGELDQDARCFHFCAFDAGRIVATLLMKPLDSRTMKMRQVAVDPAWRGKGVGALLVRHAESFAARRGCDRVSAHARESVSAFYTRLGYVVSGAPFIEVTIPHVLVVKNLR